MLSSSQAILLAEKYGSRINPVLAVIAGSWPSRRCASQKSAVRRSCQTMALWIGLPVARSQITVDLAQLLLRGGERIEGRIERDRARRRRALVDGDKCGRRVQASGPP
jgi:hypothetical protein